LCNKISVIGLGYVGLPLALAASKAGFEVFGIDTDPERIARLNSGESPIEDVLSSEVSSPILKKSFFPTSDFAHVAESEIVVICVPTPLGKDGTPDLSYVESATISVAQHMREKTLIILESTVAPGTTRNFVLPLIESISQLSRAQFDVVFAPERIDPTNKIWNLVNTPKILSGYTPNSLERAKRFYSNFIDTLISCESLEIAEMVKLLENSFRLINISFINEVSKVCQQLGINVKHVIDAAASKPYGFMPFYSGLGAGGHCIPVDPVYLSSKAKELGIEMTLLNLAININQTMPFFYVQRAEKLLGSLEDKKILVIGVAYKANVSDVRETPVATLVSGLSQKGAHVSWHDDLVKEWNGEKSVALSSDYDLAILATPHDYLELAALGSVPILNTRESI
jgi:UDP-N-acetyl-D-glucosamine dehydrogenase